MCPGHYTMPIEPVACNHQTLILKTLIIVYRYFVIDTCHTFYNVVFILDNCIIIQVLYILQRTTLRPNKK